MKKALITGISGFVGSHLTEYLLAQRITILGITHPEAKFDNLKSVIKKIEIESCNVLNKNHLRKILKKQNFDYVFHLAAFPSPQQSFEDPKSTLENNIIGQLNLLEVLSKEKSKAKILIVGSSEEYGNVDKQNSSVDEKVPLNPITPYAVSKVAQDFLGLQYFLHRNLKIVRVRPFNHIGPRQSTAFVVPSFASQIAKIENKGIGTIHVGNLDSWRDFTDVRDICSAYFLALEKGKLGEVYNIGSQKAYKISNILKKLISFSNAQVKIVKDKKFSQKTDVKKIICDASKFKLDTGWRAKISIETSLFDTMEYERRKYK